MLNNKPKNVIMKINFILLIYFVMSLLSISCESNSDNNEEPEKVELTLICDEKTGNITIDQENTKFEKGTTVELSADPKEGFEFEKWVVDGEFYSSENPINYKIENEVAIQAVFGEQQDNEEVKLHISWNETSGKVKVTPEKDSYNKGDEVKLEAIANNGYTFVGWEGLSNDQSEVTVTLSNDLNVKAHFVKNDEGTSKPDFNLEFTRVKNKSNQTYYYKVKAIFKPISNKDKPATLKIGIQTLELNNGFYSFSASDIEVGKELDVELSHESLESPLITKIVIPESFPEPKYVLRYIEIKNFIIDWKAVECDGYLMLKKVGNFTGVVEYSFGFDLITNTTTRVDSEDILSGIGSSIPFNRFTICIVPVNVVDDFGGFSSSSRIVIQGSGSSWVTNYYDIDYWGL